MGLSLLASGLICSTGTLAQAQAPLRPPGAGTAVAQPPLLSGGASIDLAVPQFQSRVVTVSTPANRVSVANPDVADIVVISPTELYVLGKDLGTTNVLLWDHSNHLIGAINIEVQHDLDSLKRKFAELLPGQPIEVREAHRSIVLSGRVSDAEAMNEVRGHGFSSISTAGIHKRKMRSQWHILKGSRETICSRLILPLTCRLQNIYERIREVF